MAESTLKLHVFKPSPLLLAVAALAALLVFTIPTAAQTEDAFGDAGADPVKLFDRGQNAHARGDLAKALEFYEEALKVRPDFPEAEFQRSVVLVAIGRLPDAESGFRRAIELKKNWPLPYSALAALLIRMKRDPEAETLLRQAMKLDAQSSVPIRLLADIRLRAGDPKEALELSRRATKDPDAPLATWLIQALAERATGDNVSALATLDHIIKTRPLYLDALIERAEIRLATGDKEQALKDLAAAEPLIKDDKGVASRLAAAYELAGNSQQALRVAKAFGLTEVRKNGDHGAKAVLGTPEEIEAANSEDSDIARKALETLLKKNPDNSMLLARLGDAYRKVDPNRSIDFYQRALQIEPRNVNYATGYSSALVQARHFAEAVAVLRQVIAQSPDNYVAHANLATALYSLKSFAEALTEYQWLLAAKPELSITHYFIATAHDNLGEYELALASYELFLAKANPQTNELEIEKVKLRLPSLRRQIQLGQGVKQTPANRKQ